MTSIARPSTRVLVAQIGARRRYALPIALWKESLLDRFCTDIMGANPLIHNTLNVIHSLTGHPSVRNILQRSKTDLPPSLVREFPSTLLRVPSRSSATVSLSHRAQRWESKNRIFCNRVRRDGFGTATTVLGFNTAALEIFVGGKQRGLACVLDQTNAGWRSEWRTRLAEHDKWPDWEPHPGSEAELKPLIEREEEEWKLADRILCGSSYVVDQIATTASLRAKCSVVIPGRPLSSATDRQLRQPQTPLRVLFVGTLELRKGIQYLDQSAKTLNRDHYEFRIIGPSSLHPHRLDMLGQHMQLRGTVPHAELPLHFAWADVLVLPSMSEGSAGICCEALAHGLPCIVTPEAGSPVVEGCTGYIIPSGTHEPITEALSRLQADPALCKTLSVNARRSADLLSIETYGRNLRQVLTKE